MSITFHYDEQNNILYETGSGVLTLNDFVEFRVKLISVPLRSGLRCLSDYINANVNLSFDDMNNSLELTKSAASNLENIRIAIVVPDDLGYGMARMYSLVTEGTQFTVEVFKTIDDAKLWLNL